MGLKDKPRYGLPFAEDQNVTNGSYCKMTFSTLYEQRTQLMLITELELGTVCSTYPLLSVLIRLRHPNIDMHGLGCP